MTSMKRNDLNEIEDGITAKGIKITLQIFLGVVFFIIIYNNL
jgi:hypothetical protein